jgi:hypothetical protein
MSSVINHQRAQPGDSEPLRIIYVAGSMRSGSTLLGEILAPLYGCIVVGELTDIWEAIRLGETCSCGEDVMDCPLWGYAWDGLRNKWQIDTRQLEELQEQARAAARLHLLRCRLGRPRGEYATLTTDMLSNLARMSVTRTIVETTKHPAGLSERLGNPKFEVHVVHLVRDPRAVVAAHMRSARRPYQRGLPPGDGMLRATAKWIFDNVAIRRLASKAKSYSLVTYDEIVARPDATRARIRAAAGIDDMASEQIMDHQLVGNPSRLRGSQHLAVDERWRGELRCQERWLISAVAVPAYRWWIMQERRGE